MLLKAAKKAGLDIGDITLLKQIFFEGFNGAADIEAMKEIGIDFTKAIRWMEKIFNKVIVQNGNLVSLRGGKVTDWKF